MLRQLQHHSVAAGIVVGTRVHRHRVRTARARVLASQAQMVVVRAHHDEFIPQALVLTREHGHDVMSGALHISLPIGEVMIEARFLLALHDRLQLQAAQLADYIVRGQRIACSAGVSAAQLLRSQIFHRLPHVVLLLCLSGPCEGESQ